jgi:hypothetical protein
MAQQSHESYVEYGEIKGPSNFSFGLTVGSVLCVIALLRLYWTKAIGFDVIAFASLGAILLALAALAPNLLMHPNRLWMKLGLLLARIVNPIIMFAMFSLVFVPIGIVMRLFKRDALRRERNPQAASYWIERQPPGPPADGIVNQF